jgi:hypothetical protein
VRRVGFQEAGSRRLSQRSLFNGIGNAGASACRNWQSNRPISRLDSLEADRRVDATGLKGDRDFRIDWTPLSGGLAENVHRLIVAKIQSEVDLHPFILAYGYQENIERLIRRYGSKRSPYKNWVFPTNPVFAPGVGDP